MSATPLRRRVLFGRAAATACLVAAFGPAAPRPARAAEAPAAPIQRLSQAMLTIMKQGRATPFAQRASELAPALESALNIPQILRLSVGASWTSLPAAEQQRLLEVFRQYILATFVENFNSYDGQTVTVLPNARALGDGAQVVRQEIIPANGTNPHALDYVMRPAPDGTWKATDVLADGTISRVAVLRSDFAALLARGGAPALVASLQQKTATLRSG